VACGTADNPNGDAYFQDVYLDHLIVATQVNLTEEAGVTPIPGPTGPAGADGEDGLDGISILWLGSLSSAPESPLLNNAYYDTTYKASYIWDGDSWEVLCHDGIQGIQGPAGETGATGPAGNDGADGSDGSDGADGSDGISISWQGSLASAPASPSLNMAYYNTVDCKSYIYDGDSWEILCQDGSGGSGGGSLVYHCLECNDNHLVGSAGVWEDWDISSVVGTDSVCVDIEIHTNSNATSSLNVGARPNGSLLERFIKSPRHGYGGSVFITTTTDINGVVEIYAAGWEAVLSFNVLGYWSYD
jgi:hypothetical protein